MSIYIPPRPAPAAPPPAVKAGPLGPGAGPLQTEFPLAAILGRYSPQERMLQYAALGRQVLWVRAAEQVIGNAFASVPWHLEDEDGDTADDADATALEREAFGLVDNPMANVPAGDRMTRTELWKVTSYLMGTCGSAFWLRDQPNLYGIPAAFKLVQPWRMTADEDAYGNLTGWRLDRTPTSPGIPIRLDQVVHFRLEPNVTGHFGVGLMESAILKSKISVALDDHVAQVLASGGRLAGIVSPKQNDALSSDQYRQLEQDFRTITEQPDAARRVNILRGPIDFTATTMSIDAMRVVELMQDYEDGLLALWGVPKSMLGLHDRGRGLGASQVTDKDDETLWRNSVIPRLTQFRERLQADVLDLFAAAGEPLTLVLDTPAFDDQKAVYDIAAVALNLPLRNRERRELVGMDPFGDKVVGASGALLDDEVWMPQTQVLAFGASDQADNAPAPTYVPVPAPTPAAVAAAGEVPEGAAMAPASAKAAPMAAFRENMLGLRATLARTITPEARSSVAAVLADQRREVAASLRRSADHVATHPHDASVWWDARRWDAAMRDALKPPLMSAAASVHMHVMTALPQRRPGGKAVMGSRAVDRVLNRSAARITGINGTTRAKVQEAISRALEDGLSIMDVADLVEGIDTAETAAVGLDLGSLFDAYRSELIARTELMDAYNQAALGSYEDAGLSQVQAVDGDDDEECAMRDGQVYTIDEADTIDDHPNGTLDWVPVIGD